VKRFVPANFREHTIYPPLVLHQSFICFVLIHGIFSNHEVHSPFDFKHKIVGTLVIPQLNAELRERNFLRCPVDIKVYDLSRGPTIRNWPNSGSNKFFNDVATSKNGTRKVKCIFATPDPSRPMIEGRSVHNS
jgi:hypothetical protein